MLFLIPEKPFMIFKILTLRNLMLFLLLFCNRQLSLFDSLVLHKKVISVSEAIISFLFYFVTIHSFFTSLWDSSSSALSLSYLITLSFWALRDYFKNIFCSFCLIVCCSFCRCYYYRSFFYFYISSICKIIQKYHD